MRSILREQSILKDELLDAFGQSLGERGLSLATVRGYLHDLGRLRGWLEGEDGGKPRDLRRITAVDLVNYRQHLLGTERLQAATINRKLQAIKTLFGWALDKGLVKENVARVVRFVRVAERLCPQGLTESEVQSLLRVAGQTRHGLAKRNYALIELLLETGLRVGEVTDLRVADVDLHDRSGVVRVRECKGRKQRHVPLSSTARRALKLYLKDRGSLRQEDHLFLSKRGGQALSLRTIQATVSDLARRAKLTRFAVSANSLRHSFALRFLSRHPGKLVELAALLGHESIDTTAVYIRPSMEKLDVDVEEGGE
jgi:site-specific recombinase XerD